MELPTKLSATIVRIHAAPPRLVLAFAGAGSLGLAWLHSVPGSSRTVLEAIDCYAPRSLAALLGAAPAQSVSPATAAAMAAWAYARAADLAEGDWPLLGVGLTAAISTDRARRGANRCCIAVRSAAGLRPYALDLGAGDRAAEEAHCAELLIRSIAEACSIPAS